MMASACEHYVQKDDKQQYRNKNKTYTVPKFKFVEPAF